MLLMTAEVLASVFDANGLLPTGTACRSLPRGGGIHKSPKYLTGLAGSHRDAVGERFPEIAIGCLN